MMFIILLISLCAIVSYAYQCPTSTAKQHAGCQVMIDFVNPCQTVQTEMKNRINGQATGKWSDPHNNGTYTLLSQSTSLFELSRLTGDGKYTDLINFEFNLSGETSCRVEACSESQVFSIGDYGTNFCNIHDLYCDEEGCNPFYKLFYDEYPATCTDSNATQCIA